MRIGCLQFAPQVGDIDNNLNRADAVLSKANPEDLDLLVLPEMAFTGYNFKSLQEITPFLEICGSGISALWARTTALKHNCIVCVGYPEKVDLAPKWPTGPEYYNSVIIVNEDGETLGNYRKSFLYYTDETWALEGPEGFFEGYIPGLGNVALGICMDINPYKFEAPWHAFEFAFHVVEVEANVVIMSMAWLTREDGRSYTRTPNEPDMETLTYWIQRLEPLIRDESGEEIIVIFCNRTGSEDEAVYAGTSAVLGIKDGEVSVYGILGRGQKDLLVVDTKGPVYAKLLYRPEDEGGQEDDLADGLHIPHHPGPRSTVSSVTSTHGTRSSNGSSLRSRKLNADAPKEKQSASAADFAAGPSRSSRRTRPAIDIPDRQAGDDGGDNQTVPTPTAPSPTPSNLRPGASASFAMLDPRRSWGQDRAIAFDTASPDGSFDDRSPDSPQKYFWVPSDNLLKSPFNHDAGSSVSANNASDHAAENGMSSTVASVDARMDREISDVPSAADAPQRMSSPEETRPRKGRTRRDTPAQVDEEQLPNRPSSRKARDANRPREERSNSSVAQRPDMSFISSRLEALSRSDSPLSQSLPHQAAPEPESHVPGRPSSPKSRNASRSRPDLDGRASVFSGASIYIGANPSLLDENVRNGTPAPAKTPARPDSRLQHRDSPESFYRSVSHGDSPFRNPFSPPPGIPGHTGTPAGGFARLRSPSGAGVWPQPEPRDPDPLAPHRRPVNSQALHRPLSGEFERIEGIVSPNCPVHGNHAGPTRQPGANPGDNGSPGGHDGREPSTGRQGGPAEPHGGGGTDAPGAAGAQPSSCLNSGASPQAETSQRSYPNQASRSTGLDFSSDSPAAGFGRRPSADNDSPRKPSPSSFNTAAAGQSPVTPMNGPSTPKAMTIIRDDEKLTIAKRTSFSDPATAKTLLAIEQELTPLVMPQRPLSTM